MGATDGIDDAYFEEVTGVKDPSSSGTAADTTTGAENGTVPDGSSVDKSVKSQPQDTGTPQQPQQQPAPKPETQKAQDDKSKQAPAGNEQVQITRDQRGQLVDKAGNLYNDQRQIIARAGNERRLYDTVQRSRARIEDQDRIIGELQQSVAETKLLNDFARNTGLVNEEVAQALDIAAKVKRGDAIGAAKDVVAILVAQGHKVSDLFGGDVGDAVETRAIRRMIDEALAPLRQQTQVQQQTTEQERVAKQNYERFVSDNEFADLHGDYIVQIMNRNGVSAQQAYNELREYAVKNGLDFSLPLREQVLAKRGGQQEQQQQIVDPANPAPRQQPMLNGGTHTSDVSVVSAAQADPSEDWGTIIKRAMANSRVN